MSQQTRFNTRDAVTQAALEGMMGGALEAIGILKNDDAQVGQVRLVDLEDLIPSPENDKLYRPVAEDDPEVLKLAQSIRQHGVKEPLVITLDNYILSGHRRRVPPFFFVDLLRKT